MTRNYWKLVGVGAAVTMASYVLAGEDRTAVLFQTEKAPRASGLASTPVRPSKPSPFTQKIIDSAKSQTTYTNIYDPAYRVLRYPNGDLPPERGVCTDVLVRALREAGLDLQKEVHEDMKRDFRAYPQRYGLNKPDPNIDHRRVPNLMTYFRRQGKSVAVSASPGDYWPGDIVAWDLGGGVLHIGFVSDTWSSANSRFKIVHNIGAGAREEDRLFDWRVIAHYRY